MKSFTLWTVIMYKNRTTIRPRRSNSNKSTDITSSEFAFFIIYIFFGCTSSYSSSSGSSYGSSYSSSYGSSYVSRYGSSCSSSYGATARWQKYLSLKRITTKSHTTDGNSYCWEQQEVLRRWVFYLKHYSEISAVTTFCLQGAVKSVIPRSDLIQDRNRRLSIAKIIKIKQRK